MTETKLSKHNEFPFTRPEGSEAETFIQWKGTDVCVDFYCPCGAHGHFDGYFAYFLLCRHCGVTWELGTQVIVKKTEDPEKTERAVVLDPDEDFPIPGSQGHGPGGGPVAL